MSLKLFSLFWGSIYIYQQCIRWQCYIFWHFWQVFTKRWKMSHSLSDKFSQKRRKMFHSHSDIFFEIRRKRSQCLMHLWKKEEKAQQPFWQVFKIKGGKCPTVILTNFHKKEENVLLSFWCVFKESMKLSDCHSETCLKKGEKCPTIILTSFHKKEENVQWTFWQNFKKRRKMSWNHSDKFSQKGGICPTAILTSFE